MSTSQERPARVGGLPGKARVQDGAEAVDVGRRPDLAERPGQPGLLGGHVAGSAQDGARLGHAVVVAPPGQAEVGQLGDGPRAAPRRAREQDVGGLEVAVDDPQGVGLGHRIRQVSGRLRGLARGREPRADPVLERAAVDPLHDQEGQAPGLPGAVNLDDVGMA